MGGHFYLLAYLFGISISEQPVLQIIIGNMLHFSALRSCQLRDISACYAQGFSVA